MGAKEDNMSSGHDYVSNEYFVEFHRRVIIKKEHWDKVTSLLNQKKFDKAKEYLISVAPKNAAKIIEFFLNKLK